MNDDNHKLQAVVLKELNSLVNDIEEMHGPEGRQQYVVTRAILRDWKASIKFVLDTQNVDQDWLDSLPCPYRPYQPTSEELAIVDAVMAARRVQTFLWGKANGDWGLEEWKRMFRKRVAKLDDIDEHNPHAAVELKKRLLQTAALAVALIAVVDRIGIPERSSGAPPSNLPQFAVDKGK